MYFTITQGSTFYKTSESILEIYMGITIATWNAA
jgi:hypothetical protein